VSLFAMRRELKQKLVERWKSWFNVTGNQRETEWQMALPMATAGSTSVWGLCEDLEPLAAEAEKVTGHPFDVLQVKQKLGGLRVYVNHSTNVIRNRIEAAQLESLGTCEVCGQPGSRREGDWIRTACDEHASL
jgi:hypothetical protein